MHNPLRTRLTLWYVGAFSVALILFSTGVYFLVDRILRERVDSNLRLTLQTTNAAVANYVRRKPLASFSDVWAQTESWSLDQALDDPRFPG